MLLAFEVGNSNTVVGLFQLAHEDQPARLVADWRIVSPLAETADELGAKLRNLFQLGGHTPAEVHGIIVSSVVPPLDGLIREVCERHFHLKPLFIEPGVRTGLPVLTDNPAEVGADRICNSVAAFVQFGGPVVVVDMGTATNFDVVSRKGEFLGGAIAPGLGIAADALFTRAARLPRVEIKRPAKIIGTGTTDNIQIGLYYGYIGLIDGILERMIAELGAETKTVATGGLARLVAGGCRHIQHVDERLTLTGLRIVYERNMDRQRRR